MPRGVYPRSKEVDSREVPIINGEKQVDLGEILLNGTPPIETVGADALRTLDDEKFMNDMVEIHLHEPVQENEPTFCFVGVGGECMWLARGMNYTLKRTHVEALARAKTGRVTQSRMIAPDGSQSYIDKEVLSLTYPFSVISDPSPRGGTWLREILKQA